MSTRDTWLGFVVLILDRLERGDVDGLAADLRTLREWLEQDGTLTIPERVTAAEDAVAVAAEGLLADARAEDDPAAWAAWAACARAQRSLVVAAERLER